MKKSQRLAPVIKIALHHERRAAIALGVARTDQASKVARLVELNTYKNEYLEQFESSGRLTMAADKMQSFQVFLNKLCVAITLQQQSIESSELQVAHKFEIWQAYHSKLKMLESLGDRYSQDELIRAEKIAQKEIDEIGQATYQFYHK